MECGAYSVIGWAISGYEESWFELLQTVQLVIYTTRCGNGTDTRCTTKVVFQQFFIILFGKSSDLHR